MFIFCEFDRRENEAANLFVASIIPLIDRASTELSNGGHIVFWSNLDLGCEIRAVGMICMLPVTF